MSELTWQCHGCGSYRDDEWISVAHRKVQLDGLMQAIQMNARYCNDSSSCLRKVVDVLDHWEATLKGKTQRQRMEDGDDPLDT